MTRWTLQKWFERKHKEAPIETYVITFRRYENSIYVHIYKIDGKSKAEWFGTSYEEVIRAVSYFAKAEQDIRANEFTLDRQTIEVE